MSSSKYNPGDKIVWYESVGQNKWKKWFGIFVKHNKSGLTAEFISPAGVKVRKHLLYENVDLDKT
jgi:hypothetical protein